MNNLHSMSSRNKNRFIDPAMFHYATLIDVSSTFEYLEDLYCDLYSMSHNKIMSLLKYTSDTNNIKTLDGMSSSVSKSHNLLESKSIYE